MQHQAADAPALNARAELVPQTDPRWLSFVASARPSLFQAPRWCRLITAEYGFPAKVALALRGPTVVAGLPYAEVEDFRGPRRVAYPFSDFCDLLGDPSGWPAIEAALCADGLPWQIRSLAPPPGELQSVESPGVHQSVALPATSAQIAGIVHQKQRVNAQRLQRVGGTCRKVSDGSFLEPFYQLFATLRKRKFRLLPQSKTFFERLVSSYFPEKGFTLFAELNGNVLAAMILLAEGDTLYCKYSASNADGDSLRPSNFLFRTAVEEAIAGGYRRLDLGISVGSGLQRFKRHLGAESSPYYVGRYARQPKKEGVAEIEAALSKLTHILTEPELPLAAVVDGGAALYRFFV